MKIAALSVLCFCTLSAFGQNGFFLQPEFGAGVGNAKWKYPPYTINSPWLVTSPNKSVFCYNGQLLIGYASNKWIFNTGIAFFRSGYKEPFEYGEVEPLYGSVLQYYNHLMLPLAAAYRIDVGDHFSFIPSLGAGLSYNYSSSVSVDQGGIVSHHMLTGSGFTQQYNQESVWALVKLQAAYKVNRQISIVAGPELQYMISSFIKPSYDNNIQNNYTYSFNAGIKWVLPHAK